MDRVAEEIATYFTKRADIKYLVEWVALGNALLADMKRTEETMDIYEFLYYLGGIFLPNMIGAKTKAEQFAAVKEHLPLTLVDFCEDNLKNSLARLGKLYLNDYRTKAATPEMIEKYMGMLTTFMGLSELMADYEVYYSESETAA